jgi:hypothetical protein
MASSSHSSHDKKNHVYLCAHVKNVSSVAHHNRCHNHVVLPTRHDAAFNSHAMFASSSSSYAHGRNRPRRHVHHDASHSPRNASNGQTMLYQTYDTSFVLLCKNDKVVARNLGPSARETKLASGFQSLM